MRPATAQQTFPPPPTSQRLLAAANTQEGDGGRTICFHLSSRLFLLALNARAALVFTSGREHKTTHITTRHHNLGVDRGGNMRNRE